MPCYVLVAWCLQHIGGCNVAIECAGTVATDAVSGAAVCHDAGGAVLAWTVTAPFDFADIDAPTASGAFAASFVMVGTAWAIGKAVGSILSAIRR
jgi:3'-phosphoadenosine 5'-phosphosulfate (PAPS) 3'-phosphatase